MANGISLHIGINRVDPAHYAGWSGPLVACEFDANDMDALAKNRGYDTKTLLTTEATAEAVTGAISDAARSLRSDDIFFLTYSGHGGQVPDGSGSKGDEDDKLDETWVLYDRQLIDDELYQLWSSFADGVRIVILSDSCHSGTVNKVIRSVPPEVLAAEIDLDLAPSGPIPPEQAARGMPKNMVQPVYEANKETYDNLQRADGDEVDVAAGVLLISGCQDSQFSADGKRNGLFTQTLLTVWSEGQFRGGYRRFWKAIVEQMPPWQAPNFYPTGHVGLDFRRQHPFSID